MFDLNNIEVIQIELTNQCNAACPACARSIDFFKFDSKNDRAEISLDQFKQYFDKKFLKQIKRIEFAGQFGDPVMAKDIYDIIDYIKRSNPLLSISINTNGSIRNTEWWAKLGKLMRYSKDIVVWSIDGMKDTNSIYRVNTDWDKIIENAQAFISAGGHAHWAMLSFDYNEHQVYDCKKLAESLGFQEFINKQSYRHTIKLFDEAFPRKPKNYNYKLTEQNKINCIALYNKMIYVNPDGVVLPCCFFGDKIYLDTLSQSHPGILSKDHLKIKTSSDLLNIVNTFNRLINTWNTDTPCDVCKTSCSSYDFNKEVSTYASIEGTIADHAVFVNNKKK